MNSVILAAAKEDIRWSPLRWNLKDFPQNLQIRLRQLEPNRPLLTNQISGDGVCVRRVGTHSFQCGVFLAFATE